MTQYVYLLTGAKPTRDGHMIAAIPGSVPHTRKRDAMRQGNAFMRTDAALAYSHVWLVKIDNGAVETGVHRFK